MNPDTRQLELMQSDVEGLKQLSKYQSPLEELKKQVQALEEVAARQVAEPHKSKWTHFTLGESVEVIRWADGGPVMRHLRIHNLNADGLLLRGKDLSAYVAGQKVTVKGEKCEVVKISSKGLYVRGV
jgi:hypothetical protein